MSEINVVAWSEESLLQWSDFKAESHPAAFADACSVIKYRHTWTVSSEKIGSEIFFFIENLEISAEFHRLLSWVRPTQVSDALLRHEQGHFDLAEMVRLERGQGLQDAFRGKKYPTRGKNEEQRKQFAKEDSARLIQKEVDKLEECLHERRQEYDERTNFGQDLEAQSRYDLLFARLRR